MLCHGLFIIKLTIGKKFGPPLVLLYCYPERGVSGIEKAAPFKLVVNGFTYFSITLITLIGYR